MNITATTARQAFETARFERPEWTARALIAKRVIGDYWRVELVTDAKRLDVHA